MKKKITLLVLAAMMLGLLSGCFFPQVDELYSLPQPSEEYLQLQNEIDKILDSGAEYLAPVAGNNRESVQRVDLNGDGVQEAIACFMSSTAAKPLMICVFSLNSELSYELSAQISGDGVAIERMGYGDLDGDGWQEIVVGWKMSNELQIASIYSVRNYIVTEQLNAQYTDVMLYDITGDGLSDMCTIYHASTDTGGVMTAFTYSDGEYAWSAAPLSEGIQSVVRIKTGAISGKVPALFVTSTYVEGGYVTDVLAVRNGAVTNVTTNGNLETSPERVAYSSVYETDINSDGIMDIPRTVSLPSKVENANYWMLNWRTYDLRGRTTPVMKTYHCYADGWYYELPEEWTEKISVRRATSVSGVNTVVFSIWNGEDEAVTDFLRIYTLTGDNKEDRATLSGRFILKYGVDTIYAAQLMLGADEWEHMPTEEEVKAAFHIIYSEWVSGAVD